MNKSLTIEIEAAPEINLAMVENSTPLVARLALTNTSEIPLEELSIEVALLPDFSAKWTSHISSIPAGGTFQFDEIGLVLDRTKLVNQLERSGAELVVWVRSGDELLHTETRRIDVLAYNEWSRAGSPQMLAAYVLPNHPAIAELLGAAKGQLEKLTGSPALDGYQSKEPARVAAMAQAIYESMQAKDITYSNPPASFEEYGQKIRTPEQVLGDRVATCLDVSTIIAAQLEQAGLNALIVLIKGHAFPGVWLDQETARDGFIDDGAMFRKLVDLGRIAIFDSSAAVTRPPVSFKESQRVATRSLEEPGTFRYALDINEARKQHYRPLPIRVAGGYAVAVEIPVAPQSGPAGVPRVQNPDGSGRAKQSGRTRHPRVEAWKQRLLDTSLRNRLINFKDTKQSVDLLCADLGSVEDLIASGGTLDVRGRPKLLGEDDTRSRKLLESRINDDALKTFLADRFSHNEILSDHTADATNIKLTTIYRAAREALEETGTNALCLTFGMLDWYESDTSEQPRRAPILLVPVSLTRNSRTGGFAIEATGEDTRLNVTLFEKLKQEKGIDLPELAELPMDQSGVDVPAVLQIVRNAILNVRRWDVKNELHLGLFSFAKFQMWADLDQNIDALLQSPVVNHLLNGKGDAYPNQGAFTEPHELDAKIAPKDLICPMDADASQLAAVVAASEGKTFVLQGPPGTGKSQTITNLIVHCIAQGKRVLFVAEKAAALDVVQRRLTQVGLAPYVLELHSHKSGKQQVLEQFRAALEAQPVAEPTSWESNTRKLGEERARLNGYVTALHTPKTGGFSIFGALSKLDKLRDAPPIELPGSCAESEEVFDALKGECDNLGHAATALAPFSANPWRTCELPRWEVDLPSRVTELVDRTLARLGEAEQEAMKLAAGLGSNRPTRFTDVEQLAAVASLLARAPVVGEELRNPTDWTTTERDARDLAKLARSHVDAMTALRERYDEGLFRLDLEDLAGRFRKFLHSFFLIAWWGLRGAKKTIRTVARGGALPARAQISDDLNRASTMKVIERDLAARHDRAQQLYGETWRATESDPDALEQGVEWATRLRKSAGSVRQGLLPARYNASASLEQTANSALAANQILSRSIEELSALLGWKSSFDEGADQWDALRQQLQAWRTDISRLRDMHGYLQASRALTKAGCGALVSTVARDGLGPQQIMSVFERGVLTAWTRKALASEPILNGFNGDQHQRHVKAFADLDRANLVEAKTVARARVAARAPMATGAATGGEMGVLQKELQKKRRHMPIRKLLGEIPSLSARLKPCFLMSPMSVATYLDPRTANFDVIVFDEASQIPTHDAVGVLARGKSAIVVGDSKQLPPTSFFQSGTDDETPDDNDFEELESILDECIAAGLPERRLDWHYRSRHESLIAFSNYHYYKNRLNTFPSALEIGPGRGVTLRQVVGAYDKGGARTNSAEAQAVVADIVARLRAPEADKRTYGIVTFSQAQQKLVEDMLDRARTDHPEIETFFAKDRPEPVIVKNLENIQGDERDVMIFSICYGPDANGKLSMNFGPMNRDGGERRLNVAITRAREELVVYTTLLPEHIDLTRTNAVGVKHLKTFLDYARRGPIAIAQALTVDGSDHFDSPFEEQVCDRLRALDFKVHTQVGCAGYRIDMGVCHPEKPGSYVVGVECDGAYYHSARSARERDRLRAQVLEGLGWQIHRIWSTDWWQAPGREVEKVQAAIESAKNRPAVQPHVPAVVEAYVPQVPSASTATERSGGSAVPKAIVPARDATPRLVARGPVSEKSGAIAYQVASVATDKRSADDVHDDEYREELKQLLRAVIEVEAPITLRVLARRISPYFGLQRVSGRLEERLRSVLRRTVRIQSDVVWRLEQNPAAYSEARIAGDDARREAQEVPVEEVANAALLVLKSSVALEHDELVKLAARALGIARVGDKVASHMASGIAVLVKKGIARTEGDRIVLT